LLCITVLLISAAEAAATPHRPPTHRPHCTKQYYTIRAKAAAVAVAVVVVVVVDTRLPADITSGTTSARLQQSVRSPAITA